jgi:hypothetical protein
MGSTIDEIAKEDELRLASVRAHVPVDRFEHPIQLMQTTMNVANRVDPNAFGHRITRLCLGFPELS